MLLVTAILFNFIVCIYGVKWFGPDCMGNPLRIVNCSNLTLTADDSETPVGFNMTVRDCTFIACPTLVINYKILQLHNITFRDAQETVFSYSSGANVAIMNSQFINCSSSNQGSIINGLFPGQISLRNVQITDNKGAAALQFSSTSLKTALVHVQIENFIGLDHYSAAVRYLSADGIWDGGSCRGSFPCAYVDSPKKPVEIRNVDFLLRNMDNPSFLGGAISVSESFNINVDIQNVNIKAVQSNNNCIYVYASAVTISNSTFVDCQTTYAYSGAITYQQGSGTVKDVTIINASGSRGGGLSVDWNSRVTLIGSSIKNSTSFSGSKKGGAIYVCNKSKLRMFGSTVLEGNSAQKGGSIAVEYLSSIVMGNTTIRNSVATLDGGGIALIGYSANFSMAEFSNATLEGNTARLYGGGMSIDEVLMDSLGLSDLRNMAFRNNKASRCGGGIAVLGNSHVILSANIISTLNSAPVGHSLCIDQAIAGSFMVNTTDLASYSVPFLNGSVYTGNIDVSKRVNQELSKLPSDFKKTSPGTKIIWKKQFKNDTFFNPASFLPEFSVAVLDYYDNPMVIDTKEPLILKIQGEGNTVMSGDVIKAVLDPSAVLSFSNLKIRSGPGKYHLTLQPQGQALSRDTSVPLPEIYVEISDCPTGQRFVELSTRDACLPVQVIGTPLRVGFAAVGLISMIFVAASTFYLYRFRGVQLIKGNSVNFLTIISVGAILSLISTIIPIVPSQLECAVSAWFETIGFFFLFSALLLKTLRIQKIFSSMIAFNSKSKKKKKKRSSTYSDATLFKMMGLGMFLVLLYMIFWTVFSIPKTVESIIQESYIVLDKCSSSSLRTTMVVIKLAVEFIASMLAYEVRNVPSNFNESKIIGFASYNWVVFGGIFSALAEFAIPSPSIAFALNQISIIAPNLISVGLLVTFKVYICITDISHANSKGLGIADDLKGSGSGSRKQGSKQGSNLELNKGKTLQSAPLGSEPGSHNNSQMASQSQPAASQSQADSQIA